MKLSKITVAVVLAIVLVATLATSVSAFSNNDLKAYLTSNHTISGTDYTVSGFQKQDIEFYLTNHPVTDAQAAAIRDKLEAAKAEVTATGVKDLSQLSGATKNKVVALVKEAGSIAGVDVKIDSKSKTFTVTDKNGTVICQSTYGSNTMSPATTGNGGSGSAAPAASAPAGTTTVAKFARTGNSVSVFAVVALIAVVAVSAYFVKKVNAK